MNALSSAIYSKLTGGTALTALLAGTTSVYEAVVPRGDSFPVVVFQLQAGGDANQTPRRRKELVYSVKAISQMGFQQAGSIDAQVDLLLHGGSLSVSGWTNYWLARETDIGYAETTPEGRNYWHVGGQYRLRLCE